MALTSSDILLLFLEKNSIGYGQSNEKESRLGFVIPLKDFLESGQTVLSNLILINYHRLGMTNDEFLFWLQLYRHHQVGEDFPDLAQIANDMGMDQGRILQLLNGLVQKQIIAIETVSDANGRQKDGYRFDLIFEKLAVLQTQLAEKQREQTQEDKVTTLFKTFEEEFGRALSPLQYQRIAQWLEDDQYAPEIILLALKEAVLNQKYNFNYIDSILLNWERNNINTPQLVDEQRKRRKREIMQKEAGKTMKKVVPKISLHNVWEQND
ncbi:MAG: DnaD domain protein [Enterococcus sp.]